MLKRIPNHFGDDTCSSCVVAGDFIYLAYHGGGLDKIDVAHQMRVAFEGIKETLSTVGATLNDIVKITIYLKDMSYFDEARAVLYEYFDKDCFPARMTATTEFLEKNLLCMIDGVAYVRGTNHEL